VTLAVRPENIVVHPSEPSGRANVVTGTVEQVMFLGESVDVHVRVGPRSLLARQSAQLAVATGDQVWVELPVDLCAVITETHGVRSRYVGADDAVAVEDVDQIDDEVPASVE
jgi:iron(III) transport system ATP-binding protein